MYSQVDFYQRLKGQMFIIYSQNCKTQVKTDWSEQRKLQRAPTLNTLTTGI